MKYFFSIFFLIQFITSELKAQEALPLYEKNNDGQYYLLRTDSLYSEKLFNEISVITKGGIQGPGKMINLHLNQEKECCTKRDPYFLLGSLKTNFKIDSPYYLISGKVDNGKLFDLKFTTLTSTEKYIDSEFKKTAIGDPEYNSWEFRWTDYGNDKIYLEKKDIHTYNNQPSDTTVYPINLKSCGYSQQDSFEILYCHPDTIENNFLYEPSWVFIYLNNKLFDVRIDYSKIPTDGYGPFHSQPQYPVGWYKSNYIFHLLYYPGFIVKQESDRWVVMNREPCRYYGECDCGE